MGYSVGSVNKMGSEGPAAGDRSFTSGQSFTREVRSFILRILLFDQA